MNLLSKLNSKAKNKPIEPRELFMNLPSRAAEYGYPRDVQGEVWKKWFDKRNEKNVIIKMNTGSGKTVVGLIILQSCLNEGLGPAIYAVPDKFLVNQVMKEAKKLGILVTTDKDDYMYSNSKAILVTTIQTIVNGHSSFGMRYGGVNYPIGSIVIDDVHACMDKINSQFMIKIDASTDVYKKLIGLFEASLRIYNPKGYIDVVDGADNTKLLLIPYWEWKHKQEDVYRVLTEYNSSDNPNIYFGLPLIKRGLETCDCIITSSAIEISPKGIDIDMISSFSGAKRRIYMSATLADDSVFVSSLGLDRSDLKNVITPEHANDIGNRLILFPKHINSAITEKEIKDKINEIAESYSVVIIVPSFKRAKFWDPDSEYTITKDDIDESIERLKNDKSPGKTIIVNRYDGIDLPGDACRMLVIDGLPPLNSIKDRYIHSIAPESTTLLREQVQRIEQGMGRGVRSNNDECCVVLMGDELSDVLSRNKGIDYFSAATKSQYNLSSELWDLLVSETESRPSVEQIFELADYSLSKDPEWCAKCKDYLATVKYSSSVHVDEKIVDLRKAFICSINHQWNEAADIISKIKNDEVEPRVKGYLYQIQAEYTNMFDAARSQEILTAGKKISRTILTPIGGIQYQKLANTIPQANAIKEQFEKMGYKCNDILVHLDGKLSNLYMGAEYNKFEEALNSLGLALGFVCSRPDKETGGYGPDNLWALGTGVYLVIECKNEATTDFIKKEYCNQLSGSVNWFHENYSGSNFHPIMIHPASRIDNLASPVEHMRVMTEKEIDKIKNNVRELYNALCCGDNYMDVNKISELLKTYKLRNDNIVREYTVPFNR